MTVKKFKDPHDYAPTRIEGLMAEMRDQVALGFDRLRAEMHATRETTRLRGCEARPAFTEAGGSCLVTAAPGRLMGWSVRATSSLLQVTFRDGREGEIIALLDVPAGATATQWLSGAGVSLTRGLYVEVTAGAGTGVAFTEGGA